MTPEETARALTPAQKKALLGCIAQDPSGERINLSRGRAPLSVGCDLRSSGRLVELGCLGHAPSWDNMFVLTAFGRQDDMFVLTAFGRQVANLIEP